VVPPCYRERYLYAMSRTSNGPLTLNAVIFLCRYVEGYGLFPGRTSLGCCAATNDNEKYYKQVEPMESVPHRETISK
jgi:hypothetical protein